jgi:2-(1,2-epoxy-1,2-dihydrophenyl)acetyl-CoA isomerase
MGPGPARTLDSQTDELLARIEDGVAVLTLHRPKRRNALTETMIAGLARCLREIAERRDVGCILLTGAGDAFCAGGDVQVLAGEAARRESGAAARASQAQGDAAEGPGAAADLDLRIRALQRIQRDTVLALYEMAIPTVASLPGAAAGAGLSLALACDLRIASERALVMTAFARVGLSGDFGGSWLLSQIVGTARARELYFLSERIDAARCERLGIVSRVVPHDALAEQAYALAHRLAHGPRIAFSYMKENLSRALASDFRSSLDAEASAMRRSQTTEDHREAAQAFVEKREPRFRGR